MLSSPIRAALGFQGKSFSWHGHAFPLVWPSHPKGMALPFSSFGRIVYFWPRSVCALDVQARPSIRGTSAWGKGSVLCL